MRYLVRLSSRAIRDLETIYEFIQAQASDAASEWFKSLVETIHSLEQFPERGSSAAENRRVRQLLFGDRANTYRILYRVDKRRGAVDVLHIRHGARASFFDR